MRVLSSAHRRLSSLLYTWPQRYAAENRMAVLMAPIPKRRSDLKNPTAT
jgi:hypothetical protein